MTATCDINQFGSVDQAPDPWWFVDFMDSANALPEYRQINDSLAAELGPLDGRIVLEVGCGTGDDVRELAGLVGDGQVVGVDSSAAMLAQARLRSEGSVLPVDFRLGDAHCLDYPNGTFDAARAKLVLTHCAHIEVALDELLRVVRPGGRLAVFDYDFDTLMVDHPDAATTREVVRCFADGHRNTWCGRQLPRLLRERGLPGSTVVPHTVVLPFAFFRTLVVGRLAGDADRLPLSAEQLACWWEPLLAAEASGEFFAAMTGFVVGVTAR